MTIKQCAIEGCTTHAIKRGMCNKHYLREWRAGVFTQPRTKAEDGSGYMHLAGHWYVTVNGRQVAEHVLIAEKALGRPLPPGAIVHHMNRIPWDNHTPFNLVICPDREYHELLHRRARELGYEKYHKRPYLD